MWDFRSGLVWRRDGAVLSLVGHEALCHSEVMQTHKNKILSAALTHAGCRAAFMIITLKTFMSQGANEADKWSLPSPSNGKKEWQPSSPKTWCALTSKRDFCCSSFMEEVSLPVSVIPQANSSVHLAGAASPLCAHPVEQTGLDEC